MRWLWSAAAAALVLWGAASVVAQPDLGAGDFGLENTEWNGLSRFMKLSEIEDAPLQPVTGLDLSTLKPSDRLVLLYPTAQMDPDEFADFIIDGGKAILADDHGGSEALLKRLGIERVPYETVQHDSFYLNKPGLPLFLPGGKHALLDGVSNVVANHPAALRTEGGAILPFSDASAGLVYDMRLGKGKVIVVGDSSLFINHMLAVRDNRQFVSNALNYLCRGTDECAPYLMVADAELSGTYTPESDAGDELEDWLVENMEELNARLDEFAEGLPGKKAVYYASLLLLIGTVAFVITVFPWRRAEAVKPKIGAPEHIRPLSEFEWTLLRYEERGVHANYALPMSILKGEFERIFFRELARGERVPEVDSPRHPPFMRTVAQRFVDRYQNALEGRERTKSYKHTLKLLRLFSRIPPRQRIFLDSQDYFTEREFLRTYNQSLTILEIMGVREEYERRTQPEQHR